MLFGIFASSGSQLLYLGTEAFEAVVVVKFGTNHLLVAFQARIWESLALLFPVLLDFRSTNEPSLFTAFINACVCIATLAGGKVFMPAAVLELLRTHVTPVLRIIKAFAHQHSNLRFFEGTAAILTGSVCFKPVLNAR